MSGEGRGFLLCPLLSCPPRPWQMHDKACLGLLIALDASERLLFCSTGDRVVGASAINPGADPKLRRMGVMRAVCQLSGISV